MRTTIARRGFVLSAAAALLLGGPAAAALARLQAGAAVVDITPPELPVLINGGMLSRSADQVTMPISARAIALSDGRTSLVLVVVDTCMMPRPLLDEVKAEAARRTGLEPDHMMISATHAHSVPSCMGALGTDADPKYPAFLAKRLVAAIQQALERLEPAEVGFGRAQAPELTALRRWIRRPDRIARDPFGNPTVRANMHAARRPDDVTGPSGPEDPELTLIALRTPDGRPLAALANFSMHYFSGVTPVHPDYFGLFREELKRRLGAGDQFVAVMSHGCSGDIWRRDYAKPPGQQGEDMTVEQYARLMAEQAARAYQSARFQPDADLAMVERRMTLRYRTPNNQLLEWAQRIVNQMGDRAPANTEEVYAREQVYLHERQAAEVVVQAIRIGRIGVATTPTETYALTGLKIKRASPLPDTMVIELANGGDGYIPPPEQHVLGGYNTWPARTAGLEVPAEPKIAEACIELLEAVAGRPRRAAPLGRGPAAEGIAALKPLAWWRLDEMAGPRAVDASGHDRDAFYEPGVVFFLPGPNSDRFCGPGQTNRAAMFAGGRLQARLSGLGDRYSVSLWLWNGMPEDARGVTGWLVSRGPNYGLAGYSEHLGVGGTNGPAGRLIFQQGADGGPVLAGTTAVGRWAWRHAALVRDGAAVRVYLNGRLEIDARTPAPPAAPWDVWFFGGRSDNQNNWEGRLDEIAVFDRPLRGEEIRRLAKP